MFYFTHSFKIWGQRDGIVGKMLPLHMDDFDLTFVLSPAPHMVLRVPLGVIQDLRARRSPGTKTNTNFNFTYLVLGPQQQYSVITPSSVLKHYSWKKSRKYLLECWRLNPDQLCARQTPYFLCYLSDS